MTNLSSYVISFEFYPPKSIESMQRLLCSAQTLTELSPAFCSVTFGAGGSTRERTTETIKALQATTTIDMVPHLSCMGFNRNELTNILLDYRAMGLQRIIALRGDLPSGIGTIGELKYACELVALIRKVTGDYFHIDVAAYPEYHPQAKSAMSDVLNLKRKYEAGANSAITQYFFNPDAYFYFLDECARQQLFMPIVPGIMPILQFNKLRQFSDNCGAEVPRWLVKRLEAYGDDINSIQAFGVEVICNLCRRLLEGGAPGLHFYTLNQADLTKEIVQQLNLETNKLKFYNQEPRLKRQSSGS